MSSPAPAFDWQTPDYMPVWEARVARLAKLRADPRLLHVIHEFYRTHPVEFITDWGMTVDTRVASQRRLPVMPFVLFPKQREWITWLVDRWRSSEDGVTDKSRDCGLSWLAMSVSCWMSLYHNDISIGFGSAKEDKVDRTGDPDCLFYKGRMFMQYLPLEFRGGWDLKKHSAHMRLQFPKTNSSITGEAGDNIGRGGRKAIYFVDESAHVEHPKLIDASLIANTDCRQDISSVNGMANSFAERRHGGQVKVFSFHYKDDPRKNAEWERKKRAATDPVIWAQEYDINYTASVEGIIIPAVHVQAAVGALEVLGLKAEGARRGALDVADGGPDANAFGVRHGVLLEHAESWKGGPSMDIYDSSLRAFLLCDTHKLEGFDYDADGLGAGVRGDANKINEERRDAGARVVPVGVFRGSGGVLDPERVVAGTDRKAVDFFENFKAQSWWALKYRFLATYRAVTHMQETGRLPEDFNAADIIAIRKDFPERAKLCTELSQPVWKLSKSGKVMVDKQPDGVSSPNLGDTVMMAFAPRRPALAIHPSLLVAERPYAPRRGS